MQSGVLSILKHSLLSLFTILSACVCFFFSLLNKRTKRTAGVVIRKSVNPQQDMSAWASRPPSFLKERVSPYGWRTQAGGSRGVNPELPLGTSLLFSFHYESNLPTILPNNFGITAYLLCVASAHRLHSVVLAGGGNNYFTRGEIEFSPKVFFHPFEKPANRCAPTCCKHRHLVQKTRHFSVQIFKKLVSQSKHRLLTQLMKVSADRWVTPNAHF